MTKEDCRRIHSETHIVRPHSWQAYGVYTEGEASGKLFATAVRASNEFMAHNAALCRAHPYGPVITGLRPIEPRTRA